MCIIFAWSGSQRPSADYNSNDSRPYRWNPISAASAPGVFLGFWLLCLLFWKQLWLVESLSLSLEPAAEGPVLLDLSLF